MLSTYAFKKIYHLVIDTGSNGILTSVNSLSVANGLCSKLVNVQAMSVKLPHEFSENMGKIGDKDFNKDANFVFLRSNKSLMPSSTANIGKIVNGKDLFSIAKMEDVTNDWIDKRKKVYSLRNVISKLELKVVAQVTETKTYFGDAIFYPFIKSELEKCDSNNNIYTDIIHEWASIAEVDIKIAFDILLEESSRVITNAVSARAKWNKICY